MSIDKTTMTSIANGGHVPPSAQMALRFKAPYDWARVLRFFAWAYAAGDTLARDAKFVPLPDKVQANAFKVLSSIVGAGGERIGVDSLRGVSNSWR